ncbi:hypothetical protein EYR40_002497 [Pleurotus pulmonarius]|nr:hypothetical protein EYR40_002497 [Pleurotus pulmonarius]
MFSAWQFESKGRVIGCDDPIVERQMRGVQHVIIPTTARGWNTAEEVADIMHGADFEKEVAEWLFIWLSHRECVCFISIGGLVQRVSHKIHQKERTTLFKTKAARQVASQTAPAKAAPRPSQTTCANVEPATAVPVRRSSRLNTSKPLPTAGPSSSKGTKESAETQKPAETKKAAAAKKVTNTKKAVDAKKTAEVKNTRKRKAEENVDDDAQVDTTDESVIAPTKKARRAPVTKTAAAEETDDAEKIPAAKKARSTRRK